MAARWVLVAAQAAFAAARGNCHLDEAQGAGRACAAAAPPGRASSEQLLLQLASRGSLRAGLAEGARRGAAACEDDPPPEWDLPCAAYEYLCADAEWGGQIRSYCPVTCGTCSTGCVDSPPASWQSCSTYEYLCTDPDWEATMSVSCPVTCGSCRSATPAASAPTPAPTAAPTAAPGAACADVPPSTWTQPCSAYAVFCTRPEYEDMMTTYCPQTCNLCGGSGGPAAWPNMTTGSTGRCRALSDNSNKLAQSLHVVLVPSGFGGDLAAFERAARRIYRVFSQYRPFDAQNIDALQVWYVDAELEDSAEQCYYGDPSNPYCSVDRLLCCPGKERLKEHAARHCGSGKIMNTLIVHNDDRFGGAGFPWAAMASVSVNESSAQIAIHELGHSLFGLGDEYTFGQGNGDEDPNCDRSGCSKWSDLIGKWGVGCKPGKCRDGGWYSAEDTMMASFTWRFGEVNERISCCKYFYHTGYAPGYCQKFNEDGLNLTSYCIGTLWHGRYTNLDYEGVSLLQDTNGSSKYKPLGEPETDPQGTRYVQVPDARLWILWELPPSAEGGEQWECVPSGEHVPNGLYLRESVEGDFEGDIDHGRWDDPGRVVVEVLGRGSRQVNRTIAFTVDRKVEVPFPLPGGDDERQPVVYERRTSMRVVLRSGEGCRVRNSARG